MKYSEWEIGRPDTAACAALRGAGYHPLLAMALAARGYDTPERASLFLSEKSDALHDPFLLADMDKAVNRIKTALRQGEKIAVYGDYDVDGITSVCLLSLYLRSQGADFVTYIPDRSGEGYGLNESALRRLRDDGVSLVITVDSGVTAIELALVAKEIGLSLVITDHHHCRETLPAADAVVNPCRADNEYPFTALAGVGVAFKLVCALENDDIAPLKKYADLVALGTLADVMLLTGENRVMVQKGLRSIENSSRPGLQALIRESGMQERRLNAAAVGFGLAPRLNAAGRIGHADSAVELLLTENPSRASVLARELCEKNQLRQQLENSIAEDVFAIMEPQASHAHPRSIVLSGDSWHHGVIGIVASRLAERYRCPVFLICIEDGMGKGSARSVRGIDLVEILSAADDLLENFGGHAMAAGFALDANNIGVFTQRVEKYCSGLTPEPPVLHADTTVPASLLSLVSAEELMRLEPFGNGNPHPVLVMENAVLTEVVPIGSGKHLKLQLESEDTRFSCVWFGMEPQAFEFSAGDMVDVAFRPEINRFRGEETLQLQIVDMRECTAARNLQEGELAAYDSLLSDKTLTSEYAKRLLPTRAELSALWRYLKRRAGQCFSASPQRLLRELVRESGHPVALSRILVGLDVFSELGLVGLDKVEGMLMLTPADIYEKRELTSSPLYLRVKRCAEGESV